MENNFSVNLNDGALTVILKGQLTTTNSPELMDELGKYKGQGIAKVIFEATELTYIASSGIRTIIFAKQKLGGNPVIEFVNCSDEIRSVFEMTGLQNYITFLTK